MYVGHTTKIVIHRIQHKNQIKNYQGLKSKRKQLDYRKIIKFFFDVNRFNNTVI